MDSNNFRCIGSGGIGDGSNSSIHAMAWFQEKLFVGVTRAELCVLRKQRISASEASPIWPVECPEVAGRGLDRRAQLWRYDPSVDRWEMVFRAAPVEPAKPGSGAREYGYRAMCVFQGRSDPRPALYIAPWSADDGGQAGLSLLRTLDGYRFERITPQEGGHTRFAGFRSLVAIEDRLFGAPIRRFGNSEQGVSDAVVFEARDPGAGAWLPVSEPGFGDPGNLAVSCLAAFGDKLYAATHNRSGFQVWCCTGTDDRYRWRKVIETGAGRGPLNPAVVSMVPFAGHLYIGTAAPGGGIGRGGLIGPVAAELIRITDEDRYDLIVGDDRSVADGRLRPLSGLGAGFGNLFNGQISALAAHDGWLYAGTDDWSTALRWRLFDPRLRKLHRFLDVIDPEIVVCREGGADLWRTCDGENWAPVTRQGFGNPYNLGIRQLVSSPIGLFAGTSNPFGPRAAVNPDGQWRYVDNPDGGIEIWLGREQTGRCC